MGWLMRAHDFSLERADAFLRDAGKPQAALSCYGN